MQNNKIDCIRTISVIEPTTNETTTFECYVCLKCGRAFPTRDFTAKEVLETKCHGLTIGSYATKEVESLFTIDDLDYKTVEDIIYDEYDRISESEQNPHYDKEYFMSLFEELIKSFESKDKTPIEYLHDYAVTMKKSIL